MRAGRRRRRRFARAAPPTPSATLRIQRTYSRCRRAVPRTTRLKKTSAPAGADARCGKGARSGIAAHPFEAVQAAEAKRDVVTDELVAVLVACHALIDDHGDRAVRLACRRRAAARE